MTPEPPPPDSAANDMFTVESILSRYNPDSMAISSNPHVQELRTMIIAYKKSLRTFVEISGERDWYAKELQAANQYAATERAARIALTEENGQLRRKLALADER